MSLSKAGESLWVYAFDTQMMSRYAVNLADLGIDRQQLVARYGDMTPEDAAHQYGIDYDLIDCGPWR